jgi:phenylacetate-CoA ligase
MRLRDNKSGFVLCPRDVLAEILADHEGYKYFQSFIGVAAGARGYRFAEVDTAFDERHAGESFLSQLPVKVSLEICGELLRYRIATLQRK